MVRFWRRNTPPARPWTDRTLWVLDLELSSLDARNGHILSAGWVAIEQGQVRLTSAGHCLFRQSAMMGDDVSASAHLHHITDQQREQGLDLGDWLREQLPNRANDLWVCHHAPLDIAFLKAHCERFDIEWPDPEVLDTLRFEKKRLPREVPGSYRDLNLNACRQRYRLPPYRAHHAFSDALATAELCLAQIRSRLGPAPTDRDLLKAFR